MVHNKSLYYFVLINYLKGQTYMDCIAKDKWLIIVDKLVDKLRKRILQTIRLTKNVLPRCTSITKDNVAHMRFDLVTNTTPFNVNVNNIPIISARVRNIVWLSFYHYIEWYKAEYNNVLVTRNSLPQLMVQINHHTSKVVGEEVLQFDVKHIMDDVKSALGDVLEERYYSNKADIYENLSKSLESSLSHHLDELFDGQYSLPPPKKNQKNQKTSKTVESNVGSPGLKDKIMNSPLGAKLNSIQKSECSNTPTSSRAASFKIHGSALNKRNRSSSQTNISKLSQESQLSMMISQESKPSTTSRQVRTSPNTNSQDQKKIPSLNMKLVGKGSHSMMELQKTPKTPKVSKPTKSPRKMRSLKSLELTNLTRSFSTPSSPRAPKQLVSSKLSGATSSPSSPRSHTTFPEQNVHNTKIPSDDKNKGAPKLILKGCSSLASFATNSPRALINKGRRSSLVSMEN